MANSETFPERLFFETISMKLRLLFQALALFQAASLPAAERVALVIGNDAYQHARPLKAAVNDATAIATTLDRLDFATITTQNAGLEQMIEAMDALKTKAVGAKAVLVYYAGHGIESQGTNYLIPVDARLEKEVQLQTQAVNLNSVLEKLTALNVPARMVILDCCRDNPLEGRAWMASRALGGGLGELPQQNLPAATLVVYSASPGKPALDRVNDADRHSPFTQALLDTLPLPGVHSFEIFGRVEEAVLTRTEGRQSPRVFYNGSTLPFRSFTFASTPSPAATHTLPTVSATQASPPPETTAPAYSLVLPDQGYFSTEELLAPSPYASYNDFTKKEILRRAQAALKSAGHYTGAPDGVPGPGTQRALVTWQRAARVPVTGRLDGPSLSALGLSGIEPMPAPKKPSPAPSSSKTPPVRTAPEPARQRSIDEILFDR